MCCALAATTLIEEEELTTDIVLAEEMGANNKPGVVFIQRATLVAAESKRIWGFNFKMRLSKPH